MNIVKISVFEKFFVCFSKMKLKLVYEDTIKHVKCLVQEDEQKCVFYPNISGSDVTRVARVL